MIIVAIIIGLLAGFAAICIRFLIKEISAISFQGPGNILENILNTSWYWILIIPAIGGMIVNPERLTKANFSEPYMNMTGAVVVEDYRRHEFKSWRLIDEKLNIRLGVVGEKRAEAVKRNLPNTDIVLLETYREFFTDNPKGVDALVISAEVG